MENRNENFVQEAEKGIAFEVSEETSRDPSITTQNIAKANEYSENYVNPPIPDAYKYVEGEWKNGFVIERCFDGSQFVWIPVGYLDSDGTLDGKHFSEKFGRRKYNESSLPEYNFSEFGFHETLNEKLLEQLESVKKYGGFYISRYNISMSSTGKPQSVKGAMPWTYITYNDARQIAFEFDSHLLDDTVQSHLPYGAEYDSILAWLIKSKAKTFYEIAKNSTKWGNYWYTAGSPNAVAETGSCEEWCANNIYDLAGNIREWTQEEHRKCYRVNRGGDYDYSGMADYPVAYRIGETYYYKSPFIGFRVALYIK